MGRRDKVGRFDSDNYDGPDGNTYYLQESWFHNAMTSKASIRRWQMIEDALAALPRQELCQGYLFDHGKVCALGAVAAFADARKLGKTVPEVLDLWRDDSEVIGDDDMVSVDAGIAAGLPQSLAWWLGSLNDENYAQMTDTERYDAVLAAVRRRKAEAMRLHPVAP
jgi:hypothetical protein